MTYGNEFAPNLFKTYYDWRQNYIKKLGKMPNREAVREAHLYFSHQDLDNDFDNDCDVAYCIAEEGTE